MNLGERIKRLRLSKPLTQKELGKRINVSELTIRCWETGSKNPSMSAIISLSKIFSVSTDYLLGVSVDEQKDSMILDKDEQSLLECYRSLDRFGKSAVNSLCLIEKDRIKSQTNNVITDCNNTIKNRYIPLYVTPSAAGFSAPIGSGDFEMVVAGDDTPNDADFAVKIQGDSMSPYICDRDIVYVRKCNELNIGDIGIFSVNGSMYCKQYYKDNTNIVTLISLNSDYCSSNIVLLPDSDADVRLYGKVITSYKIDIPNYFLELPQS